MVEKNFRRDGRVKWPEEKPRDISEKYVKRIMPLQRRCDERKRKYSVAEEPMIDLLCDLIKGLLALDPSSRLSASDALSHPFFTSVSRYRVLSPAIVSPLLSPEVGSWRSSGLSPAPPSPSLSQLCHIERKRE